MKRRYCAWVLWVVVGCSGKLTEERLVPCAADAGGGGAPGIAGSSNAGGASNVGGTSNVGGASSGGVSEAGAPAQGGSEVVAGAGGVPLGEAGAAGAPLSEAGAGGALSGCPDDVPGDCHAPDCGSDGQPVVDQSDLPAVANPCRVGTCNARGKPGSMPRSARAACQSDTGGVMCDGAGQCVECLLSADCKPGMNCSKAHACVPAPCTDLDCGGACPACADGKKCLVDSDCASLACDAETQVCIADHCQDHHQNLSESDADCGGGQCVQCEQGEGCVTNFDCKTNACDADTLTCLSNQCIDHHVDGDESDVDCGGGYCGQCLGGKKCKYNSDCLTGFCGGVPKTCQ